MDSLHCGLTWFQGLVIDTLAAGMALGVFWLGLAGVWLLGRYALVSWLSRRQR